ncbi:MAG: glycosyltransferase family 2 protein [Clostridia bacterium]|nr:glycosyltransferase family 2 protein [Clostridia bacterium]
MGSRIQVLVASMHQKNRLLPIEMNLQSDAIIGNQSNENKVECFEYNGHEIKYYSFAERGVGLNRNNTLMRADAEYCLIADDDMKYYDGYPETVEKAFAEHPDADVLIFNVDEPMRKPYVIRKAHRVNHFNYMRYATFRFAFRTEAIRRRGIAFNLSFGGGAKYSHGEDSLFLCDCLNKDLRIMALPISIATLTYTRESTWFKGFDDRYFSDQGALFAAISRKSLSLLCLQDVIRHRKKYAVHGSVVKNYRMMKKGANAFLKDKK